MKDDTTMFMRTFPFVAITLAALAPLVRAQDSSVATQGTPRSSETVPSLLLNNWHDLIAIHYARQLTKDDPRLFGPYLSGLHSRVDRPANQIDGAMALISATIAGGGTDNGLERKPALCESSGEVKGNDAAADPGLRHSYPSIMCFDDGAKQVLEAIHRPASAARP